MASVALGFAGKALGTLVGGPIGGLIGGAIGSALGQLVDNMLFAGKEKIEGPRLNDKRVTASTYGEVIPLVYGPENRLGGNMIWSSGIIETVHKKKQKSGKKKVTIKTYTYSVDMAIAFAAGPCSRLKKIWANGKVIFDLSKATVPPLGPTAGYGMIATRANKTHAVFDTVRFYQGNGTQDIDPTMESYLGVGNAPAYRHTCYIVLVGLQLSDYGNGIPNIEVLLEGHQEITVAQVVRDICVRAGCRETDAVASGIGFPLRGFIVSRAGTAINAIQPLALAYHFDATEQFGQVRFTWKGRAPQGTIDKGDLGARPASSDPDEPIRIERQHEFTLPKEAALTFADPALDYQPNTQTARRMAGNADSNLSTELPLTLTASEGRRIADRLLWSAWLGRTTATFSVTDRWFDLQSGDLFAVIAAERRFVFRITRKTRAANGVHQIEAMIEDREIYLSDAAGIAGTLPPNEVLLPGPTRLVLLDMPIVLDENDDPGFYWAADAESLGWRGAELLRSADDGMTYELVSPIGLRAVIGDVQSSLPWGPSEFWDRGNVLTVQFPYERHELESLTELSVLNSGNAAWVGSPDGKDGEVIQFASATALGGGIWELRNLLRGRLGTEHAISSHGPGEIFVLLEPDTLGRSDFGVSDWNRDRLYKPVSLLTEASEAVPQIFSNSGEGKRPLAPVHVRGLRDGSNNLTVTWFRRTRLRVPGLGRGSVPLGEDNESYEVEILDGANVVRTIAATATSVTYTAAQQVADGLTPGDPVTVRIYQFSATRGRGRPASATV